MQTNFYLNMLRRPEKSSFIQFFINMYLHTQTQNDLFCPNALILLLQAVVRSSIPIFNSQDSSILKSYQVPT